MPRVIRAAWLLPVLIALTSTSPVNAGPCDILANSTSLNLWPTAVLRACMATIPYNADVATRVISSLTKTLALMPNADVALNSPTKELPLQADIRKAVADIGKKQYKNDLEFSNALSTAFGSVRDKNVEYRPACYEVTSEIAFPLVLFWEGGRPVVQIRTEHSNMKVLNATSLLWGGRDLRAFDRAAVEAIEGVPAYAFLLSYANASLSAHRDVSARLNALFLRPYDAPRPYDTSLVAKGEFSTRLGLVDGDNVTMQVRRVGQSSSEKLSVPWFSSFTNGPVYFPNVDTYYSFYCANSLYSSTAKALKGSKQAKGPLEDGEIVDPRHAASTVVAVSGDVLNGTTTTAQLLVSGAINAWLLPDNETGVIVIQDFGSLYFGDSWFSSLVLGLTTLKRVAKRIIIDLTDGVGGTSGKVDALIQYIFPSLTFSAYPNEFKATPFVEKLVKAISNATYSYSVYRYNSYSDLKGKPLVKEEFFFPVEGKTFNRRKANYSKQFTVVEKSTIFQPSYAAPLFRARDILILTNGLCYEKCAEFIYKAKEFAGVKSVAVGGIPSLPMAVGGSVTGVPYNLNSLYYFDLFDSDIRNDKDAPTILPVQATVSFPIAQTYCKESSKIPADFVFKAADFRFDYSAETVMERSKMWGEAATYFKK